MVSSYKRKLLIVGGGKGVDYSEKWERYLLVGDFAKDLNEICPSVEVIKNSELGGREGRINQFFYIIKSMWKVIKHRPDCVYVLYSPFSVLVSLVATILFSKVVTDVRSVPIKGSRIGFFLRWLHVHLGSTNTFVSYAMQEKYYYKIKKSFSIVGPFFEKEFLKSIFECKFDHKNISEKVKGAIDHGKTNVLYSGTVDSSRPLDAWIEVILRMGEGNIIVAGEVKDTSMFIEYSDKVVFLGRVNRDELVWLYNECDWGINPLNRDYEVQPSLKVVEYISGGLRVLSTDTLGVSSQFEVMGCEKLKKNLFFVSDPDDIRGINLVRRAESKGCDLNDFEPFIYNKNGFVRFIFPRCGV